jgi:RNA polymerase sigma-70 factor (ECF subfamily)
MTTVDLRLVATRVSQGDAAAFRQIVDLTRAPLYRLAARMTGNLLDAEDTLQDAYVNAFKSLRDGRWDGKSKVETWLYRIVANACIDALRKRKVRNVQGEGREPRFDGEVKAEARIALRELDALLAGLSPEDRAALVLVAVEGRSNKEAADVLGVTEGALEQRLVRTRAALRKGRDAKEANRD